MRFYPLPPTNMSNSQKLEVEKPKTMAKCQWNDNQSTKIEFSTFPSYHISRKKQIGMTVFLNSELHMVLEIAMIDSFIFLNRGIQKHNVCSVEIRFHIEMLYYWSGSIIKTATIVEGKRN